MALQTTEITRPTRKQLKERTRQRIINATIDIVRSEGFEAVSTVRLAAAAGITQPGFYVHFKSVDECLRTTAEIVVEKLRVTQREIRLRIYGKVREATDSWRSDIVRDAYEETLNFFMAERRFAELYLRSRRDLSPMGEVMRAAALRMRQEVAEDMWGVASSLGMTEAYRPHYDMLADLVSAMFLGVAEGIVDGRITDRELALSVLTRTTRAALIADAAFLGGAPDP